MGSVELMSSDGTSESMKLLAVNPTHAYHITGLVSGSNVHFMLDMGASVSLLRMMCGEGGRHRSLSTWVWPQVSGCGRKPIHP